VNEASVTDQRRKHVRQFERPGGVLSDRLGAGRKRILIVWRRYGRATLGPMDGMQIGYARVSTTDQDLTAQRDALLRLGVLDAHIYVDHGMTGANRARPGLREALAAVRSGDTLVVTKLDRLARSLRDAREIADELTTEASRSASAGTGTTPPMPSVDCCSTYSPWWRSSSGT